MSEVDQSDLYRIMDEAGLDVGTLSNGRKSMSQIVQEIRLKLAQKLTAYIEKEQHGSE